MRPATPFGLPALATPWSAPAPAIRTPSVSSSFANGTLMEHLQARWIPMRPHRRPRMMFAQDASGGYRGADYVLLRSPDAGAPPPQAAAREHIVPNVPAWSRPLCTRMVSTAWCREADADYIAIVDVLLDAGATRAP